MDRTEDQLWDFKETLEMWKSKREEDQVKFCEKIAAFVNAEGGVLIVGITDKVPRKVVGIEDIENKIKTTNVIIRNWIKYKNNFFKTRVLLLKDDSISQQRCLLIIIAQTKEIIEVRYQNNHYSYPVRSGTGLSNLAFEAIINAKKEVRQNNFNFLINSQA